MSEDNGAEALPMDTETAEPAGATTGHSPEGLISRMRETQAELDSIRAALDQQAIVAVTDKAGIIMGVNDLFCAISQYSRAELLGQKHNIVNSGHHPRQFFRDLWRTIGSGATWHGDICNRAKDGSLYWVDTTIVPRRDHGGRVRGYVSLRYDITKRKQAEAALIEENTKRAKAELLLRDVIEAVPNGIVAYDADDQLILCNAAYKELYPLMAPAVLEGTTFESILRHGLENGQFVQAKDSPAARQAWFEARMQDHRSPGRRLIQHLAGGRWLQVQEKQSQSVHTVGVCTDITELKLAERQMKLQAECDPLTGLYNRRAMLERLSRCLSSARQPVAVGALILVDLDGFKLVNDTLGHDAGDTLLVQVAERFRAAVRKTDLVARLGGDEFALIIGNVSSDAHAARVVQKLLRALDAPAQVGSRHIVTSASFGVALFPRDGATPTDLLKHADLSLYQAKGSGRSTFAIYSPSLRRSVERRTVMTEALRGVIGTEQIKVALQPQISFVNGRHTGFEALVRWQRRGKAVPPTELIAIAEESGLIVPLGYHIADTALSAFRRLLDAGFDPGSLALNVAAAQLKEPGFTHQLCGLITHHGLRHADVEIEVTENVVLDRSADAIVASLRELHAVGIAIALDDFGTGFASLAHLKRFPLNRLKIDRAFVANVTSAPDDAAIARTIISLAHSLGLQVVAEGVETEEQYQFLSNHGCDFAQGYLISTPLLGDALSAYMCQQRDFTML
ncbi:MAG: EAL domain-containing protein [Devosia sp.]|nr:EAL domain-containing protein [Devosia sp.]